MPSRSTAMLLACHFWSWPSFWLWPSFWSWAPAKPAGVCPRAFGRNLNPEHSSGPISSLFVAADVADNVGNVLLALFFVGDEGRIIIVIVFNGLVDLDIVFGFGNDGLDLAGVLLGVGFLERHQLL